MVGRGNSPSAPRGIWVKKSAVDGENDFWFWFELDLSSDVYAISRVNCVAVTEWASPVSIQDLDHTKAIGTEPFTIGHIFHLSAPPR